MLTKSQIPNALTMLRLVLACAFFAVLSLGGLSMWALTVALIAFVVAATTDALDGYLARQWKVESTFGRIMDPLCDKILVLGAFVYLAGPTFIVGDDSNRMSLTGVYPWMVVLMLLREFLVTALRGMMESAGVKFGANMFGKLKMILQSVGVPLLLIIVMCWQSDYRLDWMVHSRNVLVGVIVAVTLISGWPYIKASIQASRRPNASS